MWGDGQTDGHINLIGGLVTRNPPEKLLFTVTKIKQLQNVTSSIIIIHFHENNSKSCKKGKNIWADNICEGQTTFF